MMTENQRQAAKVRQIAKAFREFDAACDKGDRNEYRRTGLVALEAAAKNLDLLTHCRDAYGYIEPECDERYTPFKVLSTWATYEQADKDRARDNPEWYKGTLGLFLSAFAPIYPNGYPGVRENPWIDHMDRFAERLKKAKKRPRPETEDRPPVLDERTQQVVIKGQRYDVSPRAVDMLSILFAAKGAWVAGKTIGGNPHKTRARGMPKAVQDIIDTHQDYGYRIPSLVPG